MTIESVQFDDNMSTLNFGISSTGDEDISHVPHGEHQRREQAEGRRETGGEAVQQVGRSQREPPAA